MEANPDVLGAKTGADGALLDDIHRRRERAGAQQQREIAGLARRLAAGDLKIAAQLVLDGRRGDDFRLAFLDQQHRHAALDRVARGVAHEARALTVELDRHHRPLVPLVEGRSGFGEALAGDDDLFGNQQRLLGIAVLLVKQFGPERNVAVDRGLDLRRIIVARRGIAGMRLDHAYFEARGAAENILGARGVLHARQLHHDALGALLLDDRLGNAQFVDAVSERRDVLLDGRLLGFRLRLGGERRDDAELARPVYGLQRKIGRDALDLALRLVASVGVAELDDDGLCLAHDAGIGKFLLTQRVANIRDLAVEPLGERGLEIDLQQEVDAAAQIEAEIHRQRIDCGKPLGGIRDQIQRQNERWTLAIGIERLVQNVLGFELRISVPEPDLDAVGIGENAVQRNTARLERLLHRPHHRRIDLRGNLERGNLDRRRLAEEIRQGINHADYQRETDDQVSPERVAVHGCAERSKE